MFVVTVLQKRSQLKDFLTVNVSMKIHPTFRNSVNVESVHWTRWVGQFDAQWLSESKLHCNLLSGKFPNCTCNEQSHLFSSFMNLCYPDCFEPLRTALEFNMTSCVERYAVSGRECPPDSIGISPDCKCFENKSFIPYGWGCYDSSIFAFGSQNCPNKDQKFPQCDLSIDMKVLITLLG